MGQVLKQLNQVYTNFRQAPTDTARSLANSLEYREVDPESLKEFLENSGNRFFYNSNWKDQDDTQRVFRAEDTTFEEDLREMEKEIEDPEFKVDIYWDHNLRFSGYLQHEEYSFFLSNDRKFYHNESWRNHYLQTSLDQVAEFLG